ncbi:MAG TPA: hypothetical protein VF950_05340, partial [Planctomycetota bacterium]
PRMSVFLALALAAQDADYFPLPPGASWSYKMSSGQSFEMRIVGSSKVGSQACVVIENVLGPQTTREHVAVTREGLTAFKVENAFGAFEYSTPIVRAKLPFKKGDAWQIQLKEGNQLNTYHYRAEGEEPVTVPAGVFDAWKVSTTLGPAVMSNWFAKGVGLVKQVYEVNGQAMTAELVSTSLKPAAPAAPRACAKCGAVDKAGGKFCAECAAPFGTSTPPAAGLVRYESKDGKVLLYHPAGWKVNEGEQFGPGTYTVAVEEADESAGLLFMTFGTQAADSVALAGLLLGNLLKAYPDLAVVGMKSSADRARTTADVRLTMGGKKVVGRFHFFHTARAGTLYGLFAREDKWEAARPTLAQITANLAYAPEGVATVLKQGREQAATPRPEGQNLNPAWMLKDAGEREKRGDAADLPMQPVTAQDNSYSMQIPRGWVFQGTALAASAGSDARYVHGYSSQAYTVFIPGGYVVQQPGMLMSPYLPPPQALDFLLRTAQLGGELRILSASSMTEIDPNWMSQVAGPARAKGAQVDNRVFFAEFTHAKANVPCRGIFSVTCTAWPLGTAWTCMVDGSWAPANEYEKWMPVFARMAKSSKQNQGWVQDKFNAQAAESARLNRNLMTSVNELSRSYDRYNQSWWDSQKSKDYSSWAYSQTTLGQGSWVSEREGAQVVRADGWGLENTRTGERTSAVNQATFTGRDPWSGEQLNEVDTRAEYEKHIRSR